MKSAVLIATLVALLAFAGAAPPASAQDQVTLTPAGAEQFPDRSFRLTVPERRGLRSADVQVTENGDPVRKLTLRTAEGAGAGTFGTVAVIDTSASMHGAAIRSAMSAARALAAERSATQKLGFVLFNRRPRVLLAPSDDQRAIDAALATTPVLASQTHIFDAVSVALDQLKLANITAGSIVVLSDGTDTGSAVTARAIARRARDANVSIYAVGLRSRSFDTRGMKELASASRGRYIAAESLADVRPIFRQLGEQLASDYLISYRSFARPGRDVSVAIRVEGVDGVATTSYRVPGDASFVQIEPSFWTSRLATVVTALLCALLVALALWILVARLWQRPGLRERVGSFVSAPGDSAAIDDAILTGRAPGSAERSLEKSPRWIAFKQDVEIGRIEMQPVRILVLSSLATLVVWYLLAKVTGLVLVGIFALVIPWGVRTWVRLAAERQRELFSEQLPDILQGAASAIRAGHGLVAALAMVAEDAPEPSRTELLRVVSDEALGVPLDEALRVVQHRMDSRDVMQIALVAQIQREAGGNMAEVLDRITESLRQRAELRRMVKALTAQGRLSRWVVTALPLVLLLVISLLNPLYIRPLFTETLGFIMLGLAGVMMVIGSMVIGKIVNFKV